MKLPNLFTSQLRGCKGLKRASKRGLGGQESGRGKSEEQGFHRGDKGQGGQGNKGRNIPQSANTCRAKAKTFPDSCQASVALMIDQ